MTSTASDCSRSPGPRSSCTPGELEELNRAPVTIGRRLSTLAGFYRYATEEGVIEHSPAVHVRRPRLDYESHAVGLDRNELGAFLVAAGFSSPRDHALCSLLAMNGLRMSEDRLHSLPVAGRWGIRLEALVVAAILVGCGGNEAISGAPCLTTTTSAVPELSTPSLTASPSPSPAAPAPAPVPSALAVQVTPPAVVLDGFEPQPVVVAVGNTGTGTIEHLSITVSPATGVTWPPGVIEGLTLGPQDRLVVHGRLEGRRITSGTTSVVVQGRVDARTVVELATITHGPAPALAALTVSGPERLSNSRDLHLVAVVTNAGDGPIYTELEGVATGGKRIEVEVGCPQEVASGDTARFSVKVDGNDLPTGDETATIAAKVSRGPVTDVLTANHRLATSPFGESTLVGPLGLASLLLLPGLAAVVVWALVRARPRRHRGVVTPALPDVRSLGTAISMVLISAAAVETYRLLTADSLYDGYGIGSLVAVTVGTAVIASIAGLVRWWYVDWRYPVLDPDTPAATALQAIREWSLPAATLEGLPGRVVWVHDGAACVVSGIQVRGIAPGLGPAIQNKNLDQVKTILKGNESLVEYLPAEGTTEKGTRTGAVGENFRPQGRAPVIKGSLT